jgi:hypothetical protein
VFGTTNRSAGQWETGEWLRTMDLGLLPTCHGSENVPESSVNEIVVGSPLRVLQSGKSPKSIKAKQDGTRELTALLHDTIFSDVY